jgi:hypothetical protein
LQVLPRLLRIFEKIEKLRFRFLYPFCGENNETTRKLKIVNVRQMEECNDALMKDFEVLDRAYPEIHIEFVEIDGVFGPDLIDELSEKWMIPKNFMFIASPGDKFSYRISELGGVRLIM